MFHRVGLWFAALFRRRQRDADMNDELASHIEMRVLDNISAGMTPEEARRAALRRFGGVDSAKEACRDLRPLGWMEDAWTDFKFGVRLSMKQPFSAAAAIAALTLGAGLATAIFCGVNAILMRRVPLPAGERLVSMTIPADSLREFRRWLSSFEGLGSFGSFTANFKASGGPSRREACFVSANFLELMRGSPALGRGFQSGEGEPGAAPVAILSDRLWQEEFQGSPSALGASVWVDGRPATVVGIMPRDYRFPINEDVWVAANETSAARQRGQGFVFGLLKSGVLLETARAETKVVWDAAFRSTGGQNSRPPPIEVESFLTGVVGGAEVAVETEAIFVALLLAAFLLLAVTCANVALLTLSRAARRGREFAARAALGATRRRLVAQLLAETMVVSTLGTAGGALCAVAAKDWFVSRIPEGARGFASWWRFDIDWRVLAFVATLLFVVNLFAGLWPAAAATQLDVAESLKDHQAGSSGIRVAGLQRFLVVAQIAASFAILVGSVALVTFAYRGLRETLPFDPATVLVAKIELPAPDDPIRFFETLDRNLALSPGIAAAALSGESLQFGGWRRPVEFEGKSYPRPEEEPQAGSQVVSDGFFKTMNLPIVAGRGFVATDRAGSAPVAVVNAAFASRFFAGEDPLGRHFREGPKGPWITIIGSVPDLRFGNYSRGAGYYLPMRQADRRTMNLILRGVGSPAAWLQIARAEVSRLRPDLPVYGIATVRDLIDGMDNGEKASGWFLAITGLVAVFLATLGIFGLVSLSVSQRTREIGVRLALGATRGRITLELLGHGVGQLATGLFGGALLSVALVRVLGSAIPATGNRLWVYLAVAALLGFISLGAVLVPARRGARLDPMAALRCD